MKVNRRTFMKTAAFSALAATCRNVPFTRSANRYSKTLVLIELKGGNDGLNTVVPYFDPTYYKLRPRLAIPRADVIALDDGVGLHPSLAPLKAVWDARELAVVRGVGYPRANLSHFRSIEIWDTASRSDEFLAEGWLTRTFARHPPPRSFTADGVFLGSNDLGPLAGAGPRVIALADPERFLQQARLAKPADVTGNAALTHILNLEASMSDAARSLSARHPFKTTFPIGSFGFTIRAAAQVLAGSAGVAVVRLTHGGYDTHQHQANTHATLLRQLCDGLIALRSALIEVDRWDSCLVMTYSEFGRRAAENGSIGTDHGASSTHLVLGGAVRGGIYGEPMELEELDDGSCAHTIDFRSYYATALERWWCIPSSDVFGVPFPPIEMVLNE